MHASYNWIKELSGIDISPSDMAQHFTRAGLEVEGMKHVGESLRGVVVAEVKSKQKHPKRDNLSLLTVWDGRETQEVVCGAPNAPEKGRILFARLGAKLPNGMEIVERPIGGVPSKGMVCSEVELEIGADGDGIVLVDNDPSMAHLKVGDEVADALALRDTIYELSLTPNRPDALGHVGLARELALLCNVPFKLRLPDVSVAASDSKPGTQVEIVHPDRCPRYGAGFVEGAKIGPSPFSVRYRLHLLGTRAISNVVDATNYILFEWGHPIHAFDAKNLRGNKIVVRRAKSGEKMLTLDGETREFVDDDLLICDAEGPVAVAGVMGGELSGISSSTQDIVIECAYFDPRSVRRTARRLAMHTDASHRFERGVDPNAVPAVLARAKALIAQLSGGRALKADIDVYPAPIEPKRIVVRPARLSMLLGSTVAGSETDRILQGVGCKTGSATNEWLAPTWRPDIQREVDLIEEVARVRGYDQIPTQVPHVRPSTEGTARDIKFVRTLRERASQIGLTEAINYAFLAPKDLELARVPTEVVPLANPLSEEKSVLRTSLLPGLAADVRRAKNNQAERATLFELARTFHKGGEEGLPREELHLDILLSGNKRAWIGDADAYDFHDIKGAVEALVRAMTGRAPSFAPLDKVPSYLHPKRSAQVVLAGKPIGLLGELHPDVCDALDLRGRSAYASLQAARFSEVAAELGLAHPQALPKFPASTRDIALVVDEALATANVAATLQQAGGALVEAVTLFDVYRGAPIEAGKKSLAFRVTYRDPDATLTDAKVDAAHALVVKAAEAQFSAALRG